MTSLAGQSIHGIGMTSRRTRERLITRLREKDITSESVLNAIRNTPRHLFVEEALAHKAYDDTALPIGHGQTISQPWVVARMIELLLAEGKLNKVLEIGTGCGYQAAVLSHLVGQVYSVERIEPLMRQAKRRVFDLRLHNVHIKYADGTFGWPDKAPFDGIIAACARPDVPPELIEQLSEDGGRLVMPKTEGNTQWLTLIVRLGNDLRVQRLEEVKFVPFMQGTQI